MLGIKYITTTSFHPESNGSLERSHQVLKDYLRYFSNENADDWDTKIHLAGLYYNTSKHESTGFTPSELVFGMNPRNVSSLKTTNLTYMEYLSDL
ncbi:GSCOCG00011187001-RA-CDS [Cotesia congregata]|nr:GSCOCG00011187001-RA-CDS [Cotesia congregata]